jgi:hypothetical protein
MGASNAGEFAKKKHCFRGVMDEITARMLTSLNRPGGAVAQLGARLDGIEEVVGSNPIGSTNYNKLQKSPATFLFAEMNLWQN